MSGRQRNDRDGIRTAVLTLRLTQEEMLRFRVAALQLRKKRSRIVRERVADLIGGGTPPGEATVANRMVGPALAVAGGQ